ncbi:MAG TPA: alpha-amylase/4-alpha-glucanotransferase domain-containing protein [Candidatus Baltobacteraceae bacterium]|nr:alpha-amylase/4-alpha-glucanotransferase domain-containing protein [Candidatus Baltobacteraceae bacterium]
MTARISLALILHNHQPVGNFGWVIARNHELAYEPLVAALERHPGVRVALHYSGPLLEWYAAEEPAFLARLGRLVARDQVELLGGGYFEPVLAALPVGDRLAQLRRLSDALLDQFGRRPSGAWLAERVWEPDVPSTLAEAGYRWTVLDDAHLREATVPEDQLWGVYSTDDQARRIDLFATGKGLRYRIPFGEVDDVLRYLREHATEDGSRLGTMGDDGEKFGAWPTTWAHCWGEGRWMERFFEALEAEAAWLHTTTPSSWLAEHAPLARVYVPGGSYAEMGEWALEPDAAEAYRETLRSDLAAGRPEPRWMHGASWRNFQHRYREVNDLHKQMLRTSAKVGALEPGPLRDRAADQLQRGQGNDPCWHGLFGGLYLSHLRTAALGHLIAAEDLADAEARRSRRPTDGAVVRDLDLDGRPEVLLLEPGQIVGLKPDEGAGIGAWDVRAVRHPLTAVLRRRPEAYHRHLREIEELPPGEEPTGVVSPHERLVARQAGLGRILTYDAYERRSALVRLLPPGTTARTVATGAYDGPDDFVAGPFEVTRLGRGRVEFLRRGEYGSTRGTQPVEVTKVVTADRRRRRPGLGVTVTVRPLEGRLDATLCLEWSLNLSGGGGNPAAFYEPAPGRHVRFDGAGGLRKATGLRFGNRDVGLVVTARAEPAATVAWASIDTVSLSEAGAERMHQGSCLVFAWALHLAAGTSQTVHLTMEAVTDRDRDAV